MRPKLASLGFGIAVLTGLICAGCVDEDTECNAPSDCPAQTVCDIATGLCVPAPFDSGAGEPCTAPQDCPSGATCTPDGECRPGSCIFYGCIQGYSCRPVEGVVQCALGDAGVGDAGSDAGNLSDAGPDQSTDANVDAAISMDAGPG